MTFESMTGWQVFKFNKTTLLEYYCNAACSEEFGLHFNSFMSNGLNQQNHSHVCVFRSTLTSVRYRNALIETTAWREMRLLYAEISVEPPNKGHN